MEGMTIEAPPLAAPTVIPPATPPPNLKGQSLARGALALALFLVGAWTLRTFLPALAWAAVFAIAIWPLYQRVEGTRQASRHNVLIPLAFTLGVALIFLVPLALVGVQLVREAHGIFAWMQDVRQHGLPVPDFVAHLPFGAEEVTGWWQTNLTDPSGYSGMLERLNRPELVSYSRDVGSQVAHRSVLFGFTLVTLFFLFKEGPTVSEQMRRASRRAFGASGERVGQQMVASIHGTVDGLVLVGIGEGVLMGICYAIAGVPHPTLLGALTGVAAIIPFGAPLAFAVAALLLLAKGSTVAAIVVFAIGMVIATVADHFIRPVLIGGATRLPFLWVLLGILGGVETWGLLGLFLGPAIMAALILLWREWTETRDTRSNT